MTLRSIYSMLINASVAIVLLAVAAPAQAAYPGANGKIAYTHFYPLSWIFTVNPDGTDETLVSPLDDFSWNPAWSPDGTRLAYGCHNDGHICIVNADGSDLEDLGPGSDPTWSPDGTQIAVGGGSVKVMNADGSDVRTLTTGAAPEWSPDGSKILYYLSRCSDPDCDGLTFDLWVMNRDGSGQTLLRADTALHADWSPDGEKIAFMGCATAAICVMDADGTNVTVIDPGNPGSDYYPSDPAWSPDGAKFVFSAATTTTDRDIYYMNSDGSGVTLVTAPMHVEQEPDWQPLPGSSPPPTYEAPKLASPLRLSLVPVFRQCGTGANPTDGQHSPPLGTAACLPPLAQGVAHFGAQSAGAAWVAVIYGDTNGANGDQADATLRFDLSDIRTAGGADYDPNPSGSDGTLVTRLRFTDRSNSPSGTSAATATDLDFAVPFACTPTSEPALGSTCALDTSADAVSPGAVKENKATVLQVFRLRLNDSGANGVRGDSDDRLFATEGIYVP